MTAPFFSGNPMPAERSRSWAVEEEATAPAGISYLLWLIFVWAVAGPWLWIVPTIGLEILGVGTVCVLACMWLNRPGAW